MFEPTDPEVASLLADEAMADMARVEQRRRELARHRGVAWSGLAAPNSLRPQSAEALLARAQVRGDMRSEWRRGTDGRFIAAIAACQAAAQGAHAVGEKARAGSARGEPMEWRRIVLEELAFQAQALSAGLSQARLALDSAAARSVPESPST